MMKKAVVVVGSAGAGKSTLVNEYTGGNIAKVSARMFEDGTAKLTKIDTSSADLSFIDTPGIDSANFPTNMTEEIQNSCTDCKLVLLLVVNGGNRATTWLKKFIAVLENLFGSSRVSFLFWWRNKPQVLEEDEFAAREKFPKAIFLHEIEALREVMHSREDIFSVPKVHVNKKKDAPPLPLPNVQKVVKKVSSTGPATSPATVLTCAPVFSRLSEFMRLSSPPNRKALLQVAVNEVLEIKKNDTPRYQNMKLTGDAFLKFMGLTYIKGEREDISDLGTRILRLTGNDADCAMPKFFDKYIKSAHDREFSNEIFISTHGKADVVEMLLDLLRSKCSHAKLLKSVFVELVEMSQST